MSRVMYNGKRIIPAPLVTITKTYQKAGNSDIIGKIYNITINGTLVAHMGSPTSSGTFWTSGGYPSNENISSDSRLAAILRKQEALRDLFSQEGKAFEIQSADGSQPIQCYPRINDVGFEEGIWYERCNYTINIESDELYGGFEEDGDSFPQYISDAREEWSIDTQDEPESLGGSATYAVSHSVSAVGKKFYDETGAQPKQPWQYAQTYVLARLGFDTQIALASGVLNLPGYYNGWDHRRSEQVDKAGGGFSVTESWVMASGSAIESYNINETNNLESPYPVISIQGNVRGFEVRNSNMQLSTTRWTNAHSKFMYASGVAYIRAQQYSGYSDLNITPLSYTIGRNALQGTIDYSFEYDTRPMNLIENAKSEVVNISDNIGGELFASVFVLGRSRGPVLQDLGTKPSNTRSLNIEIVVQPPTYTDRTTATMKNLLINQNPINNVAYSGNINNLIAAANPANNGFFTVYQEQPQQNWDIKSGRFTYSTTWTYE